MQIKVGWKSILLGVRRDGNACAVARAIHRQVPGVLQTSINEDAICVFRRGLDGFAASTPYHVAQKIRAFDSKGLIWPFSFELQVPEPHVAAKEPSLDRMLAEEAVEEELVAV